MRTAIALVTRIIVTGIIVTGIIGLGTSAAWAQDEEAFVEANIIGIFYHEMGHAMIDILDLPVFGQEEDAADVASIFLIDELWEPEAALSLAYDAAFGFAAEAMSIEDDEIAYWGLHGPDEQRFYNTVCVFYGADPEARDDFAEDMGLPEERAESCPFEYEQAANSWGMVLDILAEDGGVPLEFIPGNADAFLQQVLEEEVAALNEMFSWPEPLVVRADSCGQANAFYDPSVPEIVFCEEFIPHLRALFQSTE